MAERSAAAIVERNNAGSSSDENAANAPPAEGNSTTAPIETRKKGRKFRLNTFRTITPNTEADFPGEQSKERKKPPEYIQFADHTYDEMETFLKNWTANTASEYRKNRAIFDSDRDGMEMFRIIGGDKNYDSHEVQDQEIKNGIGRILDTPEGWIKAEALLEQETADGAFAMGVAVSAELAKKDVNPQELFKNYRTDEDDDSGRLRRGSRRVGEFLRNHKVTAMVAGGVVGQGLFRAGAELTHKGVQHDISEAAQFLMHHMPHSEASVGSYVGGAAGLALAWYLEGRSRTDESPKEDKGLAFAASRDALLSIQNDPIRAARIKARWHVDVKDFRVNEQTQTLEMVDNPKSTANFSDVLNGISSNLQTRIHYHEDLGIPRSQIDPMPELFILRNEPSQHERTGLRLQTDVIEEYHRLQGRDAESRRPTETLSEDDARKALMLDADGRGLDDPLRGTGYPTDVNLPEYNPDRLLPDSPEYKLDKWGQASPDSRYFLLEPRKSRWYGRTSEASLRFLDRENLQVINGGTIDAEAGSTRFLRRRAKRNQEAGVRIDVREHSDPRRAIAGETEEVYVYEVHNRREQEFRAENIFFIDEDGEHVPFESFHKFKKDAPADSGHTYEYNGRDIDLKNVFVIPDDKNSAPIPFSMITVEDILVDPSTATFRHRFVCEKGAEASLDIDERMLTGINQAGRRRPLPSIPFEQDNIEIVRRDRALQSPIGDEAPTYGRTEMRYQPERLARLLPPDTSIYFDGAQTIGQVAEMIQTRRIPLREGLRLSDIQDYFRGEPIPPSASEILAEVFPRKEGIVGELLPVSDVNFLAKDKNGNSPADIQFGITDVRILNELNSLGGPDIGNFDYATGKDKWGQSPGDPFFCRAERENFPVGSVTYNLTEKIDLSSIQIDQWGQRRLYPDGRPNPFFLQQNEADLVDPLSDLALFRKAQETVWSKYTIDLVKRLKAHPYRDVSIVQMKKKEYEEEHGEVGRVLAERRKEVIERAEKLQDVETEFRQRLDMISSYEKARGELSEERRKLADYVRVKFGANHPEVNDPDAIFDLVGQYVRGETDQSFQMRGRTLQSRQALLEAEKRDHDRRVQRISAKQGQQIREGGLGLPRAVTEEDIEGWLEDEAVRYDEAQQRARDKFSEQATQVSQIQAELEQKLNEIKTKTDELLHGAETRAMHLVTFNRSDFMATAQELASTDHPEIQKLLRTSTPDEIMQKINEIHAGNNDFGWGPEENNDISRQHVVLFAMTYDKAMQDNDSGTAVMDFVNNSDLVTMIQSGISYEQIDNLSESEISRLLQESNIMTVEEAAIREAKRVIRRYVRNIGMATQLVREDLNARVTRLENQAEEITLDDEKRRIQLTLDVLDSDRQDEIFGQVETIVSDPDKYFQTRVVRESNPARFIDEQRALILMGDLTPLQQEAYTEAEKNYRTPEREAYEAQVQQAYDKDVLGINESKFDKDTKADMIAERTRRRDESLADRRDTIPLAYFQLLQTVFNYQKRNDREAYFKEIVQELPPDRVAGIISQVSQTGVIREQIGGDTTAEVFDNFYQEVREGNLTEGDVREILIGIMDSMKSRAEAMA